MARKTKVKKEDSLLEMSYPLNTVLVYSDGSFRPTDAASYAYLIFCPKTKHILKMESVACRGTTINAMELSAINKALDYPRLKNVIVFTDSMYSLMALSQWRFSWARNHWMTPMNLPVKNRELIQEIGTKLDALDSYKFVKVKAHTGDPFNSVVDYLATSVSALMRADPKFPDGSYVQ